MAISLGNVAPRHERRIRVTFTNSLAAAAFTTLSLYAVTNLDSLGISPNVIAAFVVPNSPHVVELAFDASLVQGALYQLAAVGVPAVDTTVTPGGSIEPFRLGAQVLANNLEVSAAGIDALVYGVDLVHNGADYVEGADGDLDTISGRANVQAALLRSATSGGLPWDADYGAKIRQYVDGAPGAALGARGALIRAALADPRVKDVDVQLGVETNNAQATFIENVTLIGSPAATPLKILVPAS